MSSNIENINYKDFKSICRICMLYCDVKFTRDNVISNVFYKLTDVPFEANEELPQQICYNCFDKINEIDEFSLRCKQTHSSLMNCLNNYKNQLLNEKHKIEVKANKPAEIKEEITIVEHKIQFVPVNNYFDELNSTNLKIKQEITETSYNEANEVIIPDITEFINVKNENTCNIELENEEGPISDENLDDENENENVSISSDSSDINSAENEKYVMKEREVIYKRDNETFAHLASLTSQAPSGEHPFKCEECSKTFKRSHHLKEHMLVHSDERPHTCIICSKSFKHASDLRKHMQAHSGQRTNTCVECSKSFKQLKYLKRHMQVHSGERAFQCAECSKTFNQASHLNQHMRLHTGEFPYECAMCSKSFNFASTLKQHMRLHTGERPHQCGQCSKSFKQAKNLKEHMLVHSAERPHKCGNCSKSFKHGSDLKKHMLVHSGERPHMCVNCSKTFKLPSDLKKHMRVHNIVELSGLAETAILPDN